MTYAGLASLFFLTVLGGVGTVVGAVAAAETAAAGETVVETSVVAAVGEAVDLRVVFDLGGHQEKAGQLDFETWEEVKGQSTELPSPREEEVASPRQCQAVKTSDSGPKCFCCCCCCCCCYDFCF